MCTEAPDPRLMLLPERIRARIVVSPDTGCWLWTGAVSQGRGGDYGRVRWCGAMATVHVLVQLLLGRRIRRGLQWGHECPGGPQRRCCSPDHLVRQTQSVNIRSANKKRRMVA